MITEKDGYVYELLNSDERQMPNDWHVYIYIYPWPQHKLHITSYVSYEYEH